MIEHVYKHEETEVTYLYKKATSDKRHLVVIFTGFAEKYSFANVGQAFKCDVLWVKDSYENQECYYLGKDGGLQFADATNALIENILNKRQLHKKQCTLLGGSKGGFSSLYFAIKYHYFNVVSLAPTVKIGDRLKSDKSYLAKFIAGNKDVNDYNYLIDRVIDIDMNRNQKNIYIFLSEDDEFYHIHQKPLIEKLKQYENLNLVMVNSLLAYQHNRITPYSVPLIISLITNLIEGIVPKFGYVESGNKEIAPDINQIVPTSVLDVCKIDGDNLFIEGAAFFKGMSVSTYGIYQKKLLIKNLVNSYEYQLGTALNKMFSVRFFEEYFFDYQAAGFANFKQLGINLQDIEYGNYELFTKIGTKDIPLVTNKLKSERDIDLKYISANTEYRIWSNSGQVFLSKCKLVVDFDEERESFCLNELVLKGNRLFIQGNFSVLGLEIEHWGDAHYYLLMSNSKNTYSHRLGLVHNEHLNHAFRENKGFYQKSSFATLKHQGIDISSIADGQYDLYIILSYKGALLRKPLTKHLVKEHTSFILS